MNQPVGKPPYFCRFRRPVEKLDKPYAVCGDRLTLEIDGAYIIAAGLASADLCHPEGNRGPFLGATRGRPLRSVTWRKRVCSMRKIM